MKITYIDDIRTLHIAKRLARMARGYLLVEPEQIYRMKVKNPDQAELEIALLCWLADNINAKFGDEL